MRCAHAFAVVAVLFGCSGPAKTTTATEGPEPSGDGWACFSWDRYDGSRAVKTSRCERDRDTCRDAQQRAPNAAVTTGCRRVAAVWCFSPRVAQSARAVGEDDDEADDEAVLDDLGGAGGTGAAATCLKAKDECEARRGGSDSSCVERHDGQAGGQTLSEKRAEFERLAAERDRLAKQASKTFSCFTYKDRETQRNETDCYMTRSCDDRLAEAQRSSQGSGFSSCIEAMNVWCFEVKGDKVCKMNQAKCDTKRTATKGSSGSCELEH